MATDMTTGRKDSHVGKIWAQYWITCGLCDASMPLPADAQRDTARGYARDAGWGQKSPHSWLCPTCLTNPRPRQIAPMNSRHARILAEKRAGVTHKEIAEREMISVARVGQIIKQAKVHESLLSLLGGD